MNIIRKKILFTAKSFWKIESFLIYIYFHLFYKPFYKRKFHNKKVSNRLFIFGSGSSLKNLTDDDLTKIKEQGDTMGFNAVVEFEKIEWDYFIVREFEQKVLKILNIDIETIFNFNVLFEFNKKIKESFFFSTNTKLFLCIDRKCGQAMLWAIQYFDKSMNLFFYTNKSDRKISWPPSETLKNIPHANATLNDAINIAYILGYSEIVLVGVDLYDSRYFYLNDNETREYDIKKNRNHLMKHNTTDSMMNNLKSWKLFLNKKQKSIKVLNPKSLAASFLEVYSI
jgi:hypothetical protein